MTTDKILRWGVLGTSFISDIMAQAISANPGSRLQAVSGRDAKRLEAFAGQYSVPSTYTSADALLDDPDVDVIYVGLPTNLHHEYTIKSAARGKAVLSEKSLTTDMATAHELVEAVRAADIFFVEGLMYLAHPLYARLAQIIKDGRLGTIRAISGFYAADIWQLVNPASRGTLYNLGCYPASLLQFVMREAFGPGAFARRQSSGFGNQSPNDGNICDAQISIRFDNGVLASLFSTDSFGMTHDFTIMGDFGSLRFGTNPWLPAAGTNVLEWTAYGQMPERIDVTTDHDAFYYQVQMVEHSLAKGSRAAPHPSPTLDDSLEIMELLTEWEAHCTKMP